MAPKLSETADDKWISNMKEILIMMCLCCNAILFVLGITRTRNRENSREFKYPGNATHTQSSTNNTFTSLSPATTSASSN